MSPRESGRVDLDRIEEAISALAAGRAVIVVDDEDRENEGDLIIAAEFATPEMMAFLVRYTSGFVCVSLTNERADALGLPPMVARNEDNHGTAYTVTVDAADDSTGISATARSTTVRLLASDNAGPGDFTRPGHVVPLRARDGGVLTRPGHTEAAIDLTRIAGLTQAGVISEIVSEEDSTDMARGPELRRFANRHNLPMISIAQLQTWRRHNETLVSKVVETTLPTDHGTFRVVCFRDDITGVESLALIKGEPDHDGGEDVLVRVHSECLTGDVFGSHRCDCGEQLDAALHEVDRAGRGIVVYMRGHEGRGIGLAEKLLAYALQDQGLDTVDANLSLGLPAEAREFDTAAQILKELSVSSIRLLSNNPTKIDGLKGHGIDIVELIHLPVRVLPENIRYLRTKRDRMGHTISDLDTNPETTN